MTEPLEPEHGGGLRRYLEVVRRRKWIVLVVLAAAIGAAALFSSLQKSVYRAETKIVVGQGNSLFQPTFANAVQPFTATMSDLVKSNVVATRVIDQLSLNRSPQALLDRVHVSTNPQTAVLKVSVDDHKRAVARRIAQTLGTVFSQLVDERFGHRQVTTTGGLVSGPLTATIWDPAHIDPEKVAPKPVRNIVIAAALGLVLALLSAFLREHFDRRLRSRESIEEHFGVPVIGQIPFEAVRRRDKGKRIFSAGAGAEAFRALRVNLEYLAVKRPLGTILVTSASPQQGKTTVTANLSAMIARSGAKTIAVEADLRRPRLHEAFGVSRGAIGLTDVLVGSVGLEDVVVDVPFALGEDRDGSGKLVFLPTGQLPPNPAELLSSNQMKELLERLAAEYDYVVIDSSPVLAVADALGLARSVDGVVLVARSNRTNADEARDVRALVDHLGLHFVGLILTDVRPPAAYGYGYDADPQPPVSERALASTVPGLAAGRAGAQSRRSRLRSTRR